MTDVPWSRNDALFFAQARKGQRWQEHVALALRIAGLAAHAEPLHLREHIRDAAQYANTVDVWCEGLPLEIKSSRLTFLNATDFPYHPAMVDTVAGWQAKTQKPFAYICVSQATGGMMCLRGHRDDGWLRERRRDATRDISELFYLAPMEMWRPFAALVTAITDFKERR